MAQQSTPSSDANVLRVGMIGTSVKDNSGLISKWFDCEVVDHGYVTFKVTIEIPVGKYVLRLNSGDGPLVTDGAHAVIIVYDMVVLSKKQRDGFYNSWISGLRQLDHEKTAFILVIKHSGDRPANEVGIPGDCDLDRLLNSLPGTNREVVVYYEGDDLQRYSTFRPKLLESALRGYKRYQKRGFSSRCCLL